MMFSEFLNYKNRVWGDESHACNIVYHVDAGLFYAECESTTTMLKLTESNYKRVLDQMFYDYCVENAEWMGVS